MTAVALDLLQAVATAGGFIRLEGDMLRLSAPTPLPDELRMRLRRLKPEIVQLLASRPADNPAAEPVRLERGARRRPETSRLPGAGMMANPSSWSAADWRAFFDERAGIAEFDAGLSRTDAERRAYECCVGQWLIQHPVRSEPGRCLSCGGAEKGYDALLAFGTQATGHAWLHVRCWEAWYAARKAKAVAALAAMGIEISKVSTE